MDDVRWLGFDWEDRLFYASDYFEQLYEYAVQLITTGKAYVCDLEPGADPGVPGHPDRAGQDSPYRNRAPWRRTWTCLQRMQAGEFPDGSRILRAKIDMASPNLNMRDPVMYRILHAEHHRTGDAWCIYPMYDYRPRPVRFHSRGSPIPSAPWSSRTTGRSTTGSWISCPSSATRSRSNSPAST